jgi:hypothetical protein
MKVQITSDNKSYIVRRYVDYILTRMDNNDMLGALKDYLFREKMSYPIDTLSLEINRHCPEILEDRFVEEVVGKGDEYAQAIH